MRAFDSPMDGELGVGNLSSRFSGLGVRDSSEGSIIQVMKAVEDAESTIKQLMDENERLKDESNRKTVELERYKSISVTSFRSSVGVAREGDILASHTTNLTSACTETERTQWMENSPSTNPLGTIVVHQNGISKNETISIQPGAGSQHHPDNRMNGSLKACSSGQANVYNSGVSQYSSPSSRSISPSRHLKDGEYDLRIGHGKLMTSEMNNSSYSWKQELIVKVREHEEEILQLRRHLADYSVKEAQIRNEKYVLEKRIAHMRMAFDQQQQDLVDAASKALTYRQDIIEENIRLTHALQSAQQERSTFISSLLPLLSEYGYQPTVPDALSIVSNLKILFRHLHEKLVITEEKLKESQYQITPCRVEAFNMTNIASQSPAYIEVTGVNKSGREIVPQTPYSHAHSPIPSPANAQTTADWEAPGHQRFQSNLGVFVSKNMDHDNLGKSSPVNRDFVADVQRRELANQDDPLTVKFNAEAQEKTPLYKDHDRGSGMDDSEAGLPQTRENTMQWGQCSSPCPTPNIDDPNTPYPYLPPVLEEPGSSFSEAAEDDPLPAIEGLQISGDAYPGRELQACGYSINGTTRCNFEWVRYKGDGSVEYIEGAKQPTYLVTADDVDCYLAIEVQPLDNRKRMGDLVNVFANDQRMIVCDPEMQERIERTLSIGHESFEVQIPTGVSNIWEQCVLAIKAEGYSIKCNGPHGVISEKFSSNTQILIPYGQVTELVIQSTSGVEHLLRTPISSTERDTIVLILKLFKKKAVERKGRRKNRFF